MVDFEDIDFGLEARQFGIKLLLALLQGAVELTEAVGGQAAVFVELVNPLDFFLDFSCFRFKGGKELRLLRNVLIGVVQMLGELLGREEEALEFFVIDCLQINDRNLVAA
jgi:hypothetical protein